MLELQGVSRRFGDVVALDRLSMTVAPGVMCGFVGANGAGKTTAMRAVMGVSRPDEGVVLWNGRPVDRAARRRFGYMPEERGLYPKMRVGDQMAYFARLRGLGRRAAREAARGWLARFGLERRAGERVEALSLGNQQRVQLAAALVHAPDLLVLDEPFSGLDPVGVDTLSEVLLEQVRRGVPVLFSSHQLDLVERLCESVVIIDRGRLVAAGGVQDLRAARAGRRWRVGVAGGGDWAAALPGVRVVGEGPDGALLELAADTDEQAVLAAARAAGPVRHFAREQPSLSELYRLATRDPAGPDGRAGA